MQNLPFSQPGSFYKGNLHTHSTNSDGAFPPDQVIGYYREHGYDFLALTDHFAAKYNWPVTDTRHLRSEDFTTLISAELHAPKTKLGEIWHIKAIGLPLDFEPVSEGETGPQVARRAYDAGAFIGLVHPSWYGLTREDAYEVRFAHAIEIYNHGTAVEYDRGQDWPFCEMLLNEGWHLHGYASDDAHLLTYDSLGGWVRVKSESLEPDALLQALKTGQFYSSQGPEIHDIQIEDQEVVVECSPASGIALLGRGSRSTPKMGRDMTSARLPLKRYQNSYFRVTVTDSQGHKAWSNPIWLTDSPDSTATLN